jgi:hypothetical protein
VIVIPCVSIDAVARLHAPLAVGREHEPLVPRLADRPADEQLAHFLSTQLFPRCDIVVDMHSGGRTGLCLPWSEMHWVDDADQRRQMVDGMLHWNSDWCCVYIDIAGTGPARRRGGAAGQDRRQAPSSAAAGTSRGDPPARVERPPERPPPASGDRGEVADARVARPARTRAA